MSKKIPFFEYPKLWTDHKQDYISIIDHVSIIRWLYISKRETEIFQYTSL